MTGKSLERRPKLMRCSRIKLGLLFSRPLDTFEEAIQGVDELLHLVIV